MALPDDFSQRAGERTVEPWMGTALPGEPAANYGTQRILLALVERQNIHHSLLLYLQVQHRIDSGHSALIGQTSEALAYQMPIALRADEHIGPLPAIRSVVASAITFRSSGLFSNCSIRGMPPAGTYNGHRVPTAAAIATIEKLMRDNGEVYEHSESMGASLEQVVAARGIEGKVARHGSAFCLYFMDAFAVDWHDLALDHNAVADEAMRRDPIERGVYMFFLWTK